MQGSVCLPRDSFKYLRNRFMLFKLLGNVERECAFYVNLWCEKDWQQTEQRMRTLMATEMSLPEQGERFSESKRMKKDLQKIFTWGSQFKSTICCPGFCACWIQWLAFEPVLMLLKLDAYSFLSRATCLPICVLQNQTLHSGVSYRSRGSSSLLQNKTKGAISLVAIFSSHSYSLGV